MKKQGNTTKQKKGIQSVEIGFKIIEAVTQFSSPISITKLSQVSGFSSSKIHSYLVSFKKIGLIYQDPVTSYYSIGFHALELGVSYMNQNSLLRITRPYMEELANELGLCIFFGVFGNKGPTVINRIDSTNSSDFLNVRIGSVLPMLSSAMGLNFTANMPFSLVEKWIKKELAFDSKNKPFKNLDDVLNEIKKIKQEGVSKSVGIVIPGFSAISAPIFDYTNGMVAGITLLGRIGEFDDDINSKNAKRLKKVANEISYQLGYKINQHKDKE